MHLLIDTDTAGDDVTSLLFALQWPGVSLEAVTVVAGNVPLELGVANALYTVEVANRTDVPVHAGAGAPLLRPLVTAQYVHGADGMGDSNFPAARKQPEGPHAVDAILEMSLSFPGELEIIAQGPLTNLALAVMQDRSLPGRVKRLWIMGGANNSLGNITPAAEYNFFVDPEAAHAVIHAGFATTIVPWDVCLLDGVLLREELQPVFDMKTELSEFYLAVNRGAWDFMRAHPKGPGIDGIGHPDALTAAAAMDQTVILEKGAYFVDVEYASELTRGYSSIDLSRATDQPPNAEIVLRADKRRFTDMLFQVL
ncbi:MAG: nucleoside hydrolase, partial [Actinobacteria bacterium]|nr:nucleoside hydrolase [Actinomycetota bacterium]